MWKIVIADDEPRIREGLKETIEGFNLDVQVCGEAKNGLIALDVIKQTRPQIVLADISMPKLNGMALIEELKKLDFPMEIIVITGHDEFDYAVQSIHLGVANYLLKPIDEKELYDALKRLTELFDKKREESHFYELIDDQLQKNKEHLRETFFNSWLEEDIKERERKGQMEVLAVEFPENAAILFFSIPYGIYVHDEGSILTEDLVRYTLEQAISEFLRERNPSYIFSDKYQNIIVVLPCDSAEIVLLSVQCQNNIGVLVQGKCNIEGAPCTEETFVETYHMLRKKISKESVYRPIVKEAKSYIMENFSQNDLDLPQVADAIGCNPSYLSRLMKQEIGLSFKEFLTNLRIQRSIELMKNPETTLNQIAEYIGYSNQHYFSTAFKNVMGMSPTEYRKNMKSEEGGAAL